MELSLVPLAYNLDAVLKRLDGVSSERKLRKKDLEQIFENIMADESGNIPSIFNGSNMHSPIHFNLEIENLWKKKSPYFYFCFFRLAR